MNTTEKSRKQRASPAYQEWRKEYEKTEKFKNRVREYARKRRADPATNAKQKEYTRNYITRNRVAVLARHVIARCKKSGMECDEDFIRSFSDQRPQTCPCCGNVIEYAMSGKRGTPLHRGPSFDRVDNTKGYIPGNVAIICFRCNALKRDAGLAELENIVRYMKRHLR